MFDVIIFKYSEYLDFNFHVSVIFFRKRNGTKMHIELHREVVHIRPHVLRRPPIGRELSVVPRIRRAFTRCCKTLDDRRRARAGWLSPVPARQTASRCNYSARFRIISLPTRFLLFKFEVSVLPIAYYYNAKRRIILIHKFKSLKSYIIYLSKNDKWILINNQYIEGARKTFLAQK